METRDIEKHEHLGIKLVIVEEAGGVSLLALFWQKSNKERVQLTDWNHPTTEEGAQNTRRLISFFFFEPEKVHFPDGLEPKTAANIVLAIRDWHMNIT